VWEESGGDPHKVQQVIRPETISSQLALARYFVGRGRLKEALELFRHAGDAATEERLALLRELLAEKRFIEAYEVWSSGRTEGSNADNNGLAVIINGGFEDDIDMSEQGFGWRLAPDAQAVSVYLDSNKPSTGSRSLHFEFNGNAPSTGIVSQLVLVEAKTRYRLSFAARTQNIVTGGLPVVRVANANRDEQTLGVGTPLAIDTDEWQDYSVEFTTEEATSAVLIEIRRQPCTRMPCPIYGNIWLDSFLLQSSFERRGS
jgi:hypothetical protein